MKIAKHTGGYTNVLPTKNNSSRHFSCPRTVTSHGPKDGLKIPRAEAHILRECLRDIYPDLADKPFSSTRLCW